MVRLALRSCGAVLLAVVLLLLPAAQPPAAAATLPSPTKTCAGVWVVVEISPKQQTVRCATKTADGLAALKSAGFTITKAGSGSNAYLCAIQHYPKDCKAAWKSMRYWSYWKAKLNPDGSWGDWEYSNKGAGSSKPTAGYAEGWRFVDGRAVAPSLKPPQQYTSTPTPTISGGLEVGAILTAHPGDWSPTPGFSYRWYRSGKKISGATKATYRLTKKDKGKRITVKVTGARSGWETVTVTSKKTGTVKK